VLWSTQRTRIGNVPVVAQTDNLTDRRNLAMFFTIGTHQPAEPALDGRGVTGGVATSSRAVLFVARHGVVDWQIQ